MMTIKRLLNWNYGNKLTIVLKEKLNSKISIHNLTCSHLANFHTERTNCAKVFVDRENIHAYGIIESINKTCPPNTLKNVPPTSNIVDELSFNSFMDQNWREKSPSDILNAFETIADFCVGHNISISDVRFDRLTDGLMDNVEKLTDPQLLEFLDVLRLFPACESFKSHNYHDIWSALDDVCCWKISDWPTEKLFVVADKWYKLSLGKVCDFIYEMLEKLSRRPDRLTKNQLVHAFFFMNVCRKRPLDFEYEAAVEKLIDDMSVDETAIVGLGYFKTQSKVKIPHICSVMIKKVKEADSVHEMSLCAILKIVRYSAHPVLSDQISDFLDHLTSRLQTTSTLCIVHAALLGTTLQIRHEPLLQLAAQRIAENIDNVEEVRLKDIERILLPLTMFNIEPTTTPNLYEAAFKEIHQDRRRAEITKHPKCLASALLFFSIRNYFSHELMNFVLDNDFIVETYGKSSKSLPRELFTLDVNIEIECPDYKGNRLNKAFRYKAAKWLSEWLPTYDQKKKLSAAERVVLDVIDATKEVAGGEEFLYVNHILPHFSRADIILCKDKSTGKFVTPKGFENYILGDVMRPYDTSNLDWFAIIIVGWNNTIRNTPELVGSINMKVRHLGKIGYKPVPVIWNEYLPLKQQDKLNYILLRL